MKKILFIICLLTLSVYSQSKVTSEHIKIWPNPFTNHINVRSDLIEAKNMTVYDILGNKIASFELNGVSPRVFQINLDVKSGVYIVVVGDYITKIICQK